MAKYRKRPVVIEAVQWTGRNLREIFAFCGQENIAPIERRPDYDLKIKTLEGVLKADRGDYIIKGVQGEIYPCKPDIFKSTYEQIEEGGGSDG